MKTIIDPFENYKDRYWKANKEEKGSILDTVVELTGMHRKAVVRKFHCLQIKDPSVPHESKGTSDLWKGCYRSSEGTLGALWKSLWRITVSHDW